MSINDPIAESAEEVGNPNASAKRGQSMRWLLLIGAAAIVGALVFYVMNFRQPTKGHGEQKVLAQRTLATANVGAPAQLSPEAENTRLRGQVADLQTQLETAHQQSLVQAGPQYTPPSAVLAYEPPAPSVQRMRPAPAFDQAGQSSRTTGDAAPIPHPDAASPNTSEPGAPALRRSIKLLTVSNAPAGEPTPTAKAEGQATADKVSILDRTQYVAPNSYAPATVLVGVDMQAGIAATADPKPVLFRIDGVATGVGSDGRFQTSDLRGCLVNGAAFAELSSEKVYIKLQKISCPIDGDRYLITKVDGYVTFKGKSGVRGRVVTREGNFANKALVAGTLQGLGQAMSISNQRNLAGVQTNNGVTGVASEPLSGSQVAQSAVGGGVANASSMLAEYYIKRAEQYQPVIEMPTGIQVELVFLDAFRFTNKETSK